MSPSSVPPLPILLLRPARIAGLLGLMAACLAVGGYTGQVLKYRFGVEHSYGLIYSLDLDAENNFASWFASCVLFLCALLLWLIWRVRRQLPQAGHWLGLSIIFLWLALDEMASIHERFIDVLRATLHAGGYLYYTWVVPAASFAIVVFLLYLPFLWRLPRRSRHLFLLCGALYLTGTVVLEMVGGKYASVYGERNFAFATLAHIEESFELAGSILFVYALLDYLRATCPSLLIRFERPEATRSAAAGL